MKKNFKSPHTNSSNNRKDLFASDICGCFYCLKTFNSNEIKEWIDSENDTALCPYCGVDSVIGFSSGVNVKDFLAEMKDKWF
jgi:hypothetical protein